MNIDEQIRSAELRCKEEFERVERNARITTERVLRAFQNNRISARHFAPTEGYGYDDIGRDALDRVFAESLCAEDALVRPQIANGTHAIFLALSGTLEPNDTVLSLTGAPYDTLESAIGLNGDLKNALTRFSIRFRSIPLEGDAIRYQKAEEQLDYIASVQEEVNRAASDRDISDIRAELTSAGVMKNRGRKTGKKEKPPQDLIRKAPETIALPGLFAIGMLMDKGR